MLWAGNLEARPARQQYGSLLAVSVVLNEGRQDFELQVALIFDAISPALDGADLVVQALHEPERDTKNVRALAG